MIKAQVCSQKGCIVLGEYCAKIDFVTTLLVYPEIDDANF